MALLAEELVEEWLNRQGYFTIRGIKLGVHEMDLLAVRPDEDSLEGRHIEVQASVRPVSYISRVPKRIQDSEGRAPTSAKERSLEELREGVQEWIEKKFELPRKVKIRSALATLRWSRELVVHRLRHPEEVQVFEAEGIVVHHLRDIIQDLKTNDFPIPGTSGADFVDLVLLGQDDE